MELISLPAGFFNRRVKVSQQPADVIFEELAGAEAEQILRQLQNYPEVKVVPHVDGPVIIEATRRALARAGYDLELLEKL